MYQIQTFWLNQLNFKSKSASMNNCGLDYNNFHVQLCCQFVQGTSAEIRRFMQVKSSMNFTRGYWVYAVLLIKKLIKILYIHRGKCLCANVIKIYGLLPHPCADSLAKISPDYYK